jgi:hypothetical protein
MSLKFLRVPHPADVAGGRGNLQILFNIWAFVSALEVSAGAPSAGFAGGMRDLTRWLRCPEQFPEDCLRVTSVGGYSTSTLLNLLLSYSLT